MMMAKAYLFCIITTLFLFCAFTSAQTTGFGLILPWNEQCMAARNDYWLSNPDVANAPLDPVYHYQNGGYREGRVWRGNLCNTAPLWANDTLCNCTQAQNWFVNFYTWLHQTPAGAFGWWLSTTPGTNGGAAWHCDYCMASSATSTTGGASTTSVSTTTTSTSTTGPAFVPLLPACQCWQARMKYWNVYADVRNANIDAVFHYQNSGGSEGRKWDCDICAVDPITTFNTTVACNDAAYRFQLDNQPLGTTNMSAWNKWVELYQSGQSIAWHGELCSDLLMNILTNSSDSKPVYDMPWERQCVQAGEVYLNTYPDVKTVQLDPVFHYEHSGYFQSWVWDDSPCSESGAKWGNDSICNCTEAQRQYAATYPTVRVEPAQQFAYWWNTGRPETGQYWNCSICIAIEAAKFTPCLEHSCGINSICTPGVSRVNCTCKSGFTGDAFAGCTEKINESIGVAAGLGAVIGVGVLIGAFSAVMLGMFWAAFKKHGSFYSAVIIVGVAFGYVSALTQLPRHTDALCTVFPWLLGVAFILVYGCLFIKTWALYEVWRNATQFKKTSLTPTTILKIIGVALLIEVIYLIIWTVIDPPRAVLRKTVDGDYQYACKCDTMVFWSIFLGVKGAWLLFGAALSVLTRNIAKEYSESKSIAYAIYNDICLLLVAIPLAILLENIPGGVLVIEVAVIVLTFTFTMCILFFDIWWGIFFPEKDVISTHIQSMHKGSGGSPNATASTVTNTGHASKGSHSSNYSASSHSST